MRKGNGKCESKHLRNSCGSESGKGERKHTGKLSTGSWKRSTGNQAEQKAEDLEAKAEGSTREATVRQNGEEKERKKQRLSSQNPKLKRTKESENSGGQKVD